MNVKLICMNNEVLSMPIVHAEMSNTIKNMLDDIEVDDADEPVIQVERITGEIMEKVIEFCAEYAEYAKDAKYQNAPNAPIDLTEKEKEDKQELEIRTRPLSVFESNFVSRGVNNKMLFEMIKAANYLHIKPMLDVCCKAVADKIKGKTPDEIKNEFDVTGDFSPDYKKRVIKENPWLKDPDADE
jgi:S-phase kinase-associated protein 1